MYPKIEYIPYAISMNVMVYLRYYKEYSHEEANHYGLVMLAAWAIR